MHTGQLPNCYDCGRFTRVDAGCAWKMIYSGCPPTPDREFVKCARCTKLNGPFQPQRGIRPEYSCGVIGPALAAERKSLDGRTWDQMPAERSD